MLCAARFLSGIFVSAQLMGEKRNTGLGGKKIHVQTQTPALLNCVTLGSFSKSSSVSGGNNGPPPSGYWEENLDSPIPKQPMTLPFPRTCIALGDHMASCGFPTCLSFPLAASLTGPTFKPAAATHLIFESPVPALSTRQAQPPWPGPKRQGPSL